MPVSNLASWSDVTIDDGGLLMAEYGGNFFRTDGGVELSGSVFSGGVAPKRFAVAPDGTLYVLGDSREVAHRGQDGGWGLLPAVGGTAQLYSIKVFAENDVWVGGFNTLRRFNGTAWSDVRSSLSLPAGDLSFNGIEGTARELLLGGEIQPAAGPSQGFVQRYQRGP